MASALLKRLEALEPLAAVNEVTPTVYGVVDRIAPDGTPHFVRRWAGSIGNMQPTDAEPTVYIIEKLEPLILKHKKWKGAYGGRAGTKSIAAMDAMLGDVNGSGSKVFCLREHMKALKNSIYAGMKSRIKSLGLNGFDPVPSHWEIRHHSGGIITFGGMQNIEDIKSAFDYKYILIEEAAKTSQETLDIIGPTLRNVDGAEIWMIWNPEASNDPMSTEFIMPFQEAIDRQGYYEDDYHLIINVSCDDNPWFAFDSSLQQEHQKDQQKVSEGRMSRARFDWIWRGAFNDDVEQTLIEPDWFDACVDSHIKLNAPQMMQGATVVTHDPSDTGDDAKGLAHRKGVVFVDVKELEAVNANAGIDDACSYANRVGADVFGWDCDGLGAPLRNQVASNFRGSNVRSFMFKGSESPHNPDAVFAGSDNYGFAQAKKNKDVFKNKRAQNYTELAERCRRTYEAVTLGKYQDPDSLISFSSNIKNLPKLRSELCRLPRKPSGTGHIWLYTKQEMRSGILLPGGQRITIPSPNMGDCVMMSFDKSATASQQKAATVPRPMKPMGINRR